MQLLTQFKESSVNIEGLNNQIEEEKKTRTTLDKELKAKEIAHQKVEAELKNIKI